VGSLSEPERHEGLQAFQVIVWMNCRHSLPPGLTKVGLPVPFTFPTSKLLAREWAVDRKLTCRLGTPRGRSLPSRLRNRMT